MKRSAWVDGIAAAIIFLFIYAAISKLFDYQNSQLQLSKSPFITEHASVLVWAVPAMEIFISLLLVFKRTRIVGFYASLFLMTVFTAYIYAMLHYSYYIPCSCGGILSHMDWRTHFWFNVVFVVLSIAGIILSLTEKGIATEARKVIMANEVYYQ